MKRSLFFLLALVVMVPMLPLQPSAAQDGTCPPAQFVDDQYVLAADGSAGVPLYANPGDATAENFTTENFFYISIIDDGPTCVNGENWYRYRYSNQWVRESTLMAYWYQPSLPQSAISVPLNPPQISNPSTPLPAMTPNLALPAGPPPFVSTWDWAAITGNVWFSAPDPLLLQLPLAENSGLPNLPIDLNGVYYADVAGLSDAQLALLAQHGFVVVPSDLRHMDDGYVTKGWEAADGTADFITTDALLNALFVVYQNALQYLELGDFYDRISRMIATAYITAEANTPLYVLTDLETNVWDAAVYYAVALQLLADGGNPEAQFMVADADPDIMAAAAPIANMVRAGEGRLAIPFLEDYTEDFSQYKPRGYYAGDPVLESYFRAMMWLGRISFRAAKTEETLTGMFVHQALQPVMRDWAALDDILAFMVGPMNNLTPRDYRALFPIEGVDRRTVGAFQAALQALPAPRVNTVVLPIGVEAGDVADLSRGYQLFGQRFTLDGYIMNELIYPQAGAAGSERILPLGLDVPTALGSDTAYDLIRQVGQHDYLNYDTNLSALRTEINAFTPDAWFENLYGGWLWALQPLALQSYLTPVMMRTDAWRYKDLNSFLGSWTQLKHATLLYTAQPSGGLGGGGEVPVVNSYSYIEPNPLVFARIAIVAALLRQGLIERGITQEATWGMPLGSVLDALDDLAVIASRLAYYATRQLNGELLSYGDYYWLQESFGGVLWYIRYNVEFWLAEPLVNMALVADVASNPAAEVVLEEAIGLPDYIYVVVPHPYGYQVTRGVVYSYYEFTLPIDQRMTDQEWRDRVTTNPPPRPSWTSLYRSE